MRPGLAHRTARLLAACAVAGLVTTHLPISLSAQPRDDKDERERIESSVQVLQEMTRAEDADGIPESLLARARAIAVIPHVVCGAFIVGAAGEKA